MYDHILNLFVFSFRTTDKTLEWCWINLYTIIMIYRIQMTAECFRDRFINVFTIAHGASHRHNNSNDYYYYISSQYDVYASIVYGASASRDNALTLSDYLAKCLDKVIMNMITVVARPNVYRTTT